MHWGRVACSQISLALGFYEWHMVQCSNASLVQWTTPPRDTGGRGLGGTSLLKGCNISSLWETHGCRWVCTKAKGG